MPDNPHTNEATFNEKQYLIDKGFILEGDEGIPLGSGVLAGRIGRGDATLYIETDPPGAIVTIENVTLDKPTPLRIDSILPGQYTVKALRDSLIATKNITLESGGVRRIAMTLEKRKTAVRKCATKKERGALRERRLRPDRSFKQ